VFERRWTEQQKILMRQTIADELDKGTTKMALAKRFDTSPNVIAYFMKQHLRKTDLFDQVNQKRNFLKYVQETKDSIEIANANYEKAIKDDDQRSAVAWFKIMTDLRRSLFTDLQSVGILPKVADKKQVESVSYDLTNSINKARELSSADPIANP
jgi:hypothetical protein